jgi:hypothetical protein
MSPSYFDLETLVTRDCRWWRLLAATVFAHDPAAFGVHVLAGLGGDLRLTSGSKHSSLKERAGVKRGFGLRFRVRGGVCRAC